MYPSKNSSNNSLGRGVWLVIAIIFTLLWAYALVRFPVNANTSIVYVFLGLISIVLVLADNQFQLVNNTPLGFMLDYPIRLITWDKFKPWHFLVGIAMLVSFLVLAVVTKNQIIGMPFNTFQNINEFTPFVKAFYSASVGLFENAVIANFAMSMIAMLFALLAQSLNKPTWVPIFYFLGVFLGGIVAGFSAVLYHSTVYAGQNALQLGNFLFFAIGAWVTGFTGDSEPADFTHFTFNFILTFFNLVPFAVAPI